MSGQLQYQNSGEMPGRDAARHQGRQDEFCAGLRSAKFHDYENDSSEAQHQAEENRNRQDGGGGPGPPPVIVAHIEPGGEVEGCGNPGDCGVPAGKG